MVKHVFTYFERMDYVAMGHDGILMPKQLIQDYYTLTKGLLDGSIVGEYKEIGFRKGDVACLGQAELWYQCDE